MTGAFHPAPVIRRAFSGVGRSCAGGSPPKASGPAPHAGDMGQGAGHPDSLAEHRPVQCQRRRPVEADQPDAAGAITADGRAHVVRGGRAEEGDLPGQDVRFEYRQVEVDRAGGGRVVPSWPPRYRRSPTSQRPENAPPLHQGEVGMVQSPGAYPRAMP